MCHIGAVPVGFKSEEMLWESAVFPFFPLGITTKTNFFNTESVIFLAVHNASASFRYMSWMKQAVAW